MTYQIEKLNEARLSDKAAKVYDCLLAHREGLTYPEIAKLTGLKERSVCGRIGDLKPLGYVWTDKNAKGPIVAYGTTSPTDIQRNIRLYEVAEDKKAIKGVKAGLKRLRDRGKIVSNDLQALYAIVHRINQAV